MIFELSMLPCQVAIQRWKLRNLTMRQQNRQRVLVKMLQLIRAVVATLLKSIQTIRNKHRIAR